MRKTAAHIMGMPITVLVRDANPREADIDTVFAHFEEIDKRFSTYKPTSEISRINAGEKLKVSDEMKEVFERAEETKLITQGYFDIRNGALLDPSGIVKGWAIRSAARLLEERGYSDFSIDAGGDIEVKGGDWIVGIRDPHDRTRVVKRVRLSNQGIATSGTYIRGNHIYNPHDRGAKSNLVSMSVIGPDVYEADRFATAAFAMGERGAYFIESLDGFEAYAIDANGVATYTSGFNRYAI